MRRRALASIGVSLLFVLVSWQSVFASSAIPLTLGEIVRESGSIVAGTIVDARPRLVNGRTILTDVVVRVDDAILTNPLQSNIVTLTFWGGTIGDQTMELAGVPVPSVGSRYIWFLRQDRSRGLTPTVGMHQGLLRLVRDPATGVEIVQEGDGSTLRPSVLSFVSGAAPPPARGGRLPGVPSRAFIDALKRRLPELRATPRSPMLIAAERAAASPTPGLPSLIHGLDPAPITGVQTTATRAVSIPSAAVPRVAPSGPERILGADVVPPSDNRQRFLSNTRLRFRPVEINQLGGSAPWSGLDVEQLQKWNYYSDIFRWAETPSRHFQWLNGRFDVAGFLTSDTLAAAFGDGAWGPDELGATFHDIRGDHIVEADVALNAHVTWTTQDDRVYDGTSAFSYRNVLLHEFGHVWGAEHYNNGLSQMGYSFQNQIMGFTMPYADDAEGLRARYGDISRRDLGIYLYRWTHVIEQDGATFFQTADAEFPAEIIAGQSMDVTGFTLENVGTQTIDEPRLEWYLTGGLEFDDRTVFLGGSVYTAPLARFRMYDPATINARLEIPPDTPPGRYRLAAFIRDDEGVSQATFPFSNNVAFSRGEIVVRARLCNTVLSKQGLRVSKRGGPGSVFVFAATGCEWTATTDAPFISVGPYLGTGGEDLDFVVDPNPGATTRTGTLQIAGITFTVTQSGTTAPADFSGDGRADRAVFTPATGFWDLYAGSSQLLGRVGDVPVPGDYDGDGRIDAAVYRPSTGEWLVAGRSIVQFGSRGDLPVPADYDGDGRTDIAVFRTTGVEAVWLVREQGTRAWGLRGDIPRPADVDGDGKADLIVFRPSRGAWHVLSSIFDETAIVSLGSPGDIPMTADFDGDGRADLVVFRPADASWHIVYGLEFRDGVSYQWGATGDIPVVLDVDGDGVAELSVFRPRDGTWHSLSIVNGEISYEQHGGLGDIPIGAPIEIPSTTRTDVDGDRRADVGMLRPSSGEWYMQLSASNYTAHARYIWGIAGDIPVPGDYDGDRRADIAMFRPADGFWYVLFSNENFTTFRALPWGIAGDVPVPADYDGDGRTDIAAYRPSSGEWFVRLSATNYATYIVGVVGGGPGDVPLPADYDGDGRANLAVYRPSNGQWLLQFGSSDASPVVRWFGIPGDVPTPADFDGDGRTDVAVYRPSTGYWFAADAASGTMQQPIQWGLPDDRPAVHDFDGDRKADAAIFRPSTGQWFVRKSSDGSMLVVQWGLATDHPLFRR